VPSQAAHSIVVVPLTTPDPPQVVQRCIERAQQRREGSRWIARRHGARAVIRPRHIADGASKNPRPIRAAVG
jgi:hypothetical protein